MMPKLMKAKKAKVISYHQSARLEGADFKLAKEYLKYIQAAIKTATELGEFKTAPVVIVNCNDATFKLIKAKLMAAGYFYTLKSNNQVLIVEWE